MAGAPLGNTNAARGFKATQALEKAVYRLSTGDDSPCVDNMEVLVEIWVAVAFIFAGVMIGRIQTDMELDGKKDVITISDKDMDQFERM